MSHSLGKGLSGKVDGADDLDSLLQSTLQELKLHQVDSADTGKTFGSHPELLNEEVKPLTCEDVGIAIKKLLEKVGLQFSLGSFIFKRWKQMMDEKKLKNLN